MRNFQPWAFAELSGKKTINEEKGAKEKTPWLHGIGRKVDEPFYVSAPELLRLAMVRPYGRRKPRC